MEELPKPDIRLPYKMPQMTNEQMLERVRRLKEEPEQRQRGLYSWDLGELMAETLKFAQRLVNKDPTMLEKSEKEIPEDSRADYDRYKELRGELKSRERDYKSKR